MYGLEAFHCYLLLGVLLLCAFEVMLLGWNSVLCSLGRHKKVSFEMNIFFTRKTENKVTP